jgi:hypothetical protein
MEWWSDGVMEWWSGGVVERRSDGVVERWRGGVMESWGGDLTGYFFPGTWIENLTRRKADSAGRSN